MTELLGLCAFLLLPLIGAGVLRFKTVQRTPLDGRIGFAAATGALIVAIVMSLMSLLGLQWTTTRLVSIFGLIAILSLAWIRAGRPSGRMPGPRLSAPMVGTAVVLVMAGYAAWSARMTCGDMTFFWAPKGIDFFRAGRIDVAFLRNPDYFLMHSDYPPLLPLLYAWSNTLSRHFAWFAAVFSSVLFLAGTIGVIRGSSGDSHGSLLVAAILSYVFVLNYTGGCADPLLLLFEAIALVAVTFMETGHSQTVLGAMGMCGAVWTKVEGAAFVIAILFATALLRRQFRRVALMALPSVALLGVWIAFASQEAMLDAYAGSQQDLYLSALPKTILLLARHARMSTLWLPWLAVLALVAIGPNRSRAALPLLVAILNIAAAIFFYLHVPDPEYWIDSSANRTLLPPLLAMCVAGVAAHNGRTGASAAP